MLTTGCGSSTGPRAPRGAIGGSPPPTVVTSTNVFGAVAEAAGGVGTVIEVTALSGSRRRFGRGVDQCSS